MIFYKSEECLLSILPIFNILMLKKGGDEKCRLKQNGKLWWNGWGGKGKRAEIPADCSTVPALCIRHELCAALRMDI